MKTPAFWYDPSRNPPLWARAAETVYTVLRRAHVACTHPVPSPLPTLCIGNAVAGGGGKTPIALALHHLLDVPGSTILSRGYGGALMGPVRVTPTHTAAQVGDEAVLMARTAPVIIARNRLQGALFAHQNGARLILMDDGLQNRTLAAQINLLVIDGAAGFGNGHLLPAGPLREPLADLFPRLHGVILVGPDTVAVTRLLPPNLPVFGATFQIDISALNPARPVAAFAGLARPEKFFASLKDAGLNVAATRPFPDHHVYRPTEIGSLLSWANRHNAQLATTQKDAVKIPTDLRAHLTVVPLTATFDDPALMKDFVFNHLSLSP